MVPYLTDSGISNGVAVFSLSLISLTAAFGSLWFGFAAEKYNIRLVVTFNYAMMGVAFLFLLAVQNPAMVFVWAAVQGILQGGSMTLFQVLFADYYGRDSLGMIRGVIQPIQLGTNAVGPLAAAFAYDHSGTYVGIFILFGVMRVLSGAMVFLAKPPAEPPDEQGMRVTEVAPAT
jgi:MFS family permease